MLLAVFFFSLMNLGVRWVEHIPAHEVVLFRSIIALLISMATLKYLGIFSWGNQKGLLVLRGVFGSAALFLFFITLQNMPFATAVTIQYLSPVFVAVAGTFILKERVRPVQWLFFGLAFGGIVLIQQSDFRVTFFYLAIGILSAAFSSLAYSTIRLMRNSDNPLVVVMYFPLVSLPVAAVLCIYEWKTPQGMEWMVLLMTGICAQLGQIFMTKSLHQEKANIVGSLNYLGIVFGLFFSYFLFKETYGYLTLMGIVLVIAGVFANLFFRESELPLPGQEKKPQ